MFLLLFVVTNPGRVRVGQMAVLLFLYNGKFLLALTCAWGTLNPLLSNGCGAETSKVIMLWKGNNEYEPAGNE